MSRIAFSKARGVSTSAGANASLHGVDNLPTCRLRQAQTAGIRRRDRRRSRQGEAEHFGHGGHRRCRPHDRAVTIGAVDAFFELEHRVFVDRAGAILGPESTAIRARAETLASKTTAQVRPAGQHDGRHVGAGGAHHLRRSGLVAVAEQHDAVEGMRANHLLGVHGHQVAVQHGGRPHEQLAERDRRELQWRTTRLPDTAFDVVRQLAEVVVAVVQVALGLGDADHRPRQVGVVEAHALGKRPPHEAVHVGVAEPLVRSSGRSGVGHAARLAAHSCHPEEARRRIPRTSQMRDPSQAQDDEGGSDAGRAGDDAADECHGGGGHDHYSGEQFFHRHIVGRLVSGGPAIL